MQYLYALSTALMLALVLFALPATAQVEQRCTDLGSNCTCSDMIDPNNWPTYTDIPGGGLDFDDTPNGTECPQGGGTHDVEGGSTYHILTGPADDFPTGNTDNTVRWYSDNQTGPIMNWEFGSGHCPGTPARVCIRWYTRFGPDWPVASGCTNFENKQQEATGGQIQGSQNSATEFTLRYQVGGDSNVSHTGDTLGPLDCQDQWCRMETCVSGSICGSGDQEIEHWVTGVDTDEEMYFAETQTSGGASFTGPSINAWHQCGPGINRWREHNYMMKAEWPTDSEQRIGAASELETVVGGDETISGVTITEVTE